EITADVVAGELAELRRARRLELEVDGRLVVLVEAGTRDAQVLAGVGGDLLDDVEAAAFAAGGAGQDLHVARQVVVVLLEQLLAARRPRFDQLELELRRLADDLLRVRDVADAGQL